MPNRLSPTLRGPTFRDWTFDVGHWTFAAVPRFGVFVLAGKPNAGKSTLLNALIDQPLAITSHKPQSTRLPVVGIRTEGDAQVAFVDPPGLLAATYALQRGMISAALEALSAADAVLHVHPITDGPPPPLE